MMYLEDKRCPRCGRTLLVSAQEEYDFYCLECDEDFYDVEVTIIKLE